MRVAPDIGIAEFIANASPETSRTCHELLELTMASVNASTGSPDGLARLPMTPPVAVDIPAPKAATAASASNELIVRRLNKNDSISEITRLLHRAYAGQVAMGLAPLAGRQDDSITRKRCESGECYVAISSEPTPSIVGTILFHEIEDAQGPDWFRRRDIDYFSQFAVDPSLQGRGLGQKLLETVEGRAFECGAVEIGLSMAEPDRGLMNFYFKRGYRFIQHWQWPYTNYRSAILSKALR